MRRAGRDGTFFSWRRFFLSVRASFGSAGKCCCGSTPDGALRRQLPALGDLSCRPELGPGQPPSGHQGSAVPPVESTLRSRPREVELRSCTDPPVLHRPSGSSSERQNLATVADGAGCRAFDDASSRPGGFVTAAARARPRRLSCTAARRDTPLLPTPDCRRYAHEPSGRR